MTWAAVWGSGDQLDSLQMAVRAVFFFLLLLALIRIGGTRIFARMSAFDNVVVIVLGAVAARWKGVASCLYREGILDADALAKTTLNEDELLATLRIETHEPTLDAVDEASLETNGKISFVSARPRSG